MPKWPRAFLVDLDNTLHDFNTAAALARREMAETLSGQCGVPAESVLARYSEILALDVDHGVVTAAEARHWRVEALTASWPQAANVESKALADQLGARQLESVIPVEGAFDALNALKREAQVMIITEGFRDMQSAVLQRLEIAIDPIDLFATRDHGVRKKDGSAHAAALKVLNLSGEHVVTIGDNWSWDIMAASRNGIWQSWIRNSAGAAEPPPPRYLGAMASIAEAPGKLEEWRSREDVRAAI